jgi:exodeoxyribonuclease-1
VLLAILPRKFYFRIPLVSGGITLRLAGRLLATRDIPAMLTDSSLQLHYKMMLQIAAKLREWSPAIFTGYNTLSFDEPLLRQAFYQTLQPVYLANTNGNQRADVH